MARKKYKTKSSSKKSPRSIIRLEEVWKIYQMGEVKVNALRGLDLNIREGEFVAVMGPSGSGKCVEGSTKIIKETGEIIPIKDLENDYKKTRILAFDKKTGKNKAFKVTKFYRRKTNSYLEIETTSGKKIRATEEHPFFTIDESGISEIRAKDLKKGTFVATARNYRIRGQSKRLESLNQLSRNKRITVSNSTSLVRNLFKRHRMSRKKICEKFNLKRSTCDSWTTKNNISLWNLKRILELNNEKLANYEGKLELTATSSGKKVKMPIRTTPELLELYGYVAGDGNLDKDGVKITNIDPRLKRRIKNLTKKVFNTTPEEFIAKRVDINSRVLKEFFHSIFEVPVKQKARTMKLPEFVATLPDQEIGAFIRGLFDCDATVSKNKKELNITLATKDMIKQLQILLLRFGIIPRYSEKQNSPDGKTKRQYHHLSISGQDNLLRYLKRIGFTSETKKKRLEDHVKTPTNTNVDVIPCGRYLTALKENRKLTRKTHKALHPYKAKINPSREKAEQLVKMLERQRVDCRKAKALLKTEIFWDRIKKVKKEKKNMTVFDITVPGADNFLANGFIIHNSTAMNMIGALDIPSKGRILLDNKDISHLAESDLAQIRGKKIGFIFQQFNLIPTLTAKENVMLPMTFQGMSREDREERAGNLLEMVGLGERMDHKPSELSGGQQQRVAIARSLANDPEVVLADEPTGNLDSKTENVIMDFLNKLHDDKCKTIVMVTHDEDVAKHAQRVEYLKDGKIVRTIKGQKKKRKCKRKNKKKSR